MLTIAAITALADYIVSEDKKFIECKKLSRFWKPLIMGEFIRPYNQADQFLTHALS
jgi:hypothetical protein